MIDASILDALLAAGATAEMIVAAVKADQAKEAARLVEKRAKDAERQRKSRVSRYVTVTTCDNSGQGVTECDNPPSVLPPRDNNSTPNSTPSPKSSLRSNLEPRDAEFRMFWDAWPNKVGKPVAAKAFAAARKRSSLGQILDGLRAYVASKPSDRPWLNPATFLNQERFNDQPAAAPRAGPPQTARNFFAQVGYGGLDHDKFTDGTMGKCGGGSDRPAIASPGFDDDGIAEPDRTARRRVVDF